MAAAISLIVAIVFFRLAPAFSGDTWMENLANFSPMAALVLCGAALFPRKWALTVPLAGWILSEVALNLQAGKWVFTSHSIAVFLSFGLIFWIGTALRRKGHGRHVGRLLGASLGGSLLFYLVTNTSFWISSSVYPRSLEGWIQCQTIGMPGYPPAYLFLRNSVVGDLFFTALFWTLMALSARHADVGQSAARATAQSSRL